MGIVTISEVETNLDDLARRVEQGETIVVTRDGVPVLDLVPHQPVVGPPRKGGINFAAVEEYKKKHGIEKIVSWISDDFDDPISEEDFLTIFEPGK